MGSKGIDPVSGSPDFSDKPIESKKKGKLQGKEVVKKENKEAAVNIGPTAKKAIHGLQDLGTEGASLDRLVIEKGTVEQKTNELLKLVAKDQKDEIRQRLTSTVKYIRANKKMLLQKARSRDPQTYYFRPKEGWVDKNEIFHIQVSIDSMGHEKIFILPKTEELGRGSFKVVRAGLNYTDNVRVACATIKDKDGIMEAHEEFQLQKKFGVADFVCTYQLIKGEEIHEKMLILMPEANQGDMHNWISQHRIDELSPVEMKQVAVEFCNFVELFFKAGIVMSDIKPENTLLHKEGSKYTVLINDVGLAYRKDDPEANIFAGTLEYTAPEVIQARFKELLYEELYDEYTETLDELKTYEEGSNLYKEIFLELKKITDELESFDQDGTVASVGFPRDVYAAGLTLSFFFRDGFFPPWISRSIGVTGSGEKMMIDVDIYPINYAKWGQKWKGKNLSKPDLEYVIFKMTDPNPLARWTISKAIDALNHIDWNLDPLIHDENFWPVL